MRYVENLREIQHFKNTCITISEIQPIYQIINTLYQKKLSNN